MVFCSDVDLLYWEPSIFADAAFASQSLLSGTGSVAGTVFTLDAGSLADAHVEAGQVIVLSGAVSGSYPIVSVESDTELTLSVLYDGLFPDEGEGVASPVGTAVNLDFSIRTFWPQRKVVNDLLLRAAGVGPEAPGGGESRVINAAALRRPCTLGTLRMIYSALAAGGDAPHMAVRAEFYERLYRRALRQVRVEIDCNGDGAGDVVRGLNVVRLRRA